MIKQSLSKINLFLYISGKRDDGYHEIYTLMHKINFFDYIKINKLTLNTIKLKTNIEELNNKNNLAYRAALLFFKASGIKPQVEIDIEKHIPVGSGLGGGSSNAAYTLKILNEMFDLPLNNDQIYTLACRLGSDVPFFLYRKPAAIAKGRGEIIEEIECDTANKAVVLVIPKINISTAYVYSKLLLTTGKPINKMPFVINGGKCSLESAEAGFYNSLEEVVLKNFKEIKTIKSFLVRQFGNALLSGSGAGIFSITNPEVREGKEIERLLESKGLFCKTVNFAEEGR